MKFFLLMSFAAAAVAQTNSAGWTFTSTMPAMPGGIVAGVPYSAEQVTEHVQTLADGTHITQTPERVMFYRDSRGRTRTERILPLPPGAAESGVVPPGIVEIADPVSGDHYSLDARNHVARKMSFPLIPPPPPPPPSVRPTIVATLSATRIDRSPLPAVTSAVTSALSTEDLGTRTIEGLSAQGSRTTVVYPVGAFGNDGPVTTVAETWMSIELKTVVLSKNSDPRYGDSTTRLSNVSLAEPDPSLFQIPSDYQIVDTQIPTLLPAIRQR